MKGWQVKTESVRFSTGCCHFYCVEKRNIGLGSVRLVPWIRMVGIDCKVE